MIRVARVSDKAEGLGNGARNSSTVAPRPKLVRVGLEPMAAGTKVLPLSSQAIWYLQPILSTGHKAKNWSGASLASIFSRRHSFRRASFRFGSDLSIVTKTSGKPMTSKTATRMKNLRLR